MTTNLLTLTVTTENGTRTYPGLTQAQCNHIITAHSELISECRAAVDWVRIEVKE